ncbi:MAG: aromatic ring-hydroxylating oxygenase subunit alpha [Burkholderiales bacterium]
MNIVTDTPASARRWSAIYPELGTAPIPIEPCISPEYFERERKAIFKRTWLNVGRVEQIPKPGDYFTIDIVAGSASIIVARAMDGTIRAFHNMCSHRGNKVVWNESGHANRFVCSFHAWVFGLDGSLRGVPDEGQFHDFRKADHALSPVALDTWEGFLFVNLDPAPRETLAEHLGEFGSALSGWPFGERSTCYAYRVEIKANWKVTMNAFQESYHVPFVHRRTVPDSAAGQENPFARPVGIHLYPRHQVLSIYANPHTRLNPIDEIVARHGPGYRKRVTTLNNMPPGINPTGGTPWGFDLDTVFPNFIMLLWGNGMYATYNFWPLAVNRTLYEVRLYNVKPKRAGEKFSHEYNRAVLRSALSEDLATLEQIQPMLESGAKTHFILQDNEIGVRHHHHVVDTFVRGVA